MSGVEFFSPLFLFLGLCTIMGWILYRSRVHLAFHLLASAFLGYYALVFMLVPWSKLLMGIYSTAEYGSVPFQVHDPEIFLEASLWSFLGALTFIGGYELVHHSVGRPSSSIQPRFPDKLESLMQNSFAFFGLIGVFIVVYGSGMSVSELYSSARFSHWQTRSTYVFLAGNYLTRLTYVALFIAILRKRLNFLVLISCLGQTVLFLGLFGSRAPVLGLLGAGFIALTLRYSELTGPRVRKYKSSHRGWRRAKRYILITVAVSSIHIGIVWQYLRYGWTQRSLLDNILATITEAPSAYLFSLTGGDLSYYFDMFVVTLKTFPQTEPYTLGTTFYRLVLLFFPHSLFPAFKPEETQRFFAKVVSPDFYEKGGTLPPSLLGDLYMNLDGIGIILGMFVFGMLIALLQVGLMSNRWFLRTAIGSSASLFVLLSVRGTIANGLLPGIFLGCCLLIAMAWLSFMKGLSRQHEACNKN